MTVVALNRSGGLDVDLAAESAEALFGQAATAFCDSVVPVTEIVPREARTLHLKGTDTSTLLLAWLAELRTIYHTEGTLFSRARVRLQRSAEGGRLDLRAQLWGEPVDPSRHSLRPASPPRFDRAEVQPMPEPSSERVHRWTARAWSTG
jgi:SHS2 domain-containing protein